MDKKLYKVDVSSLEIRKTPSSPSKISLLRGAIVENVGKSKMYRSEEWAHVRTFNEPYQDGFVLKKYISKI